VGQRGHSKSRAIIFFFKENETKIINWEEDFCTFVHHRTVSAVNRAECVLVTECDI